jgi:SPP1 gp7 family putative phage head morphogenesis protein
MDDRNKVLDNLERSQQYKRMEKLIQKALFEQWQDLALSGIINTLFNRYKEFVIQRKRFKIKKSFKKQVEEEVASADLKSKEKEQLKADKILTPMNVLKIGSLLLFLESLINKNTKSIANYYNFKPEMRNWLNIAANKGGQSIISLINPSVTFRLSKAEYKAKIGERVNTLVKGLDDTTKKRLTNSLVKGIRDGETKSEMVKRIQKEGFDLSKNRAKRIVGTETEAINEYMRYETARLNGVTSKQWITVGDERVCPMCGPMHGKTIKMPTNFKSNSKDISFEGLYPPVHPTCRCWVTYNVNTSLCSAFIKNKKTSFELIDEILAKAKKEEELYTPGKAESDTCVNPEACWAGGESLVGVDKAVGNFYNNISEDENFKEAYKLLLGKDENGTKVLEMFTEDFKLMEKEYGKEIYSKLTTLKEAILLTPVENLFLRNMTDTELKFLQAKYSLTESGFIQLKLNLGIIKK